MGALVRNIIWFYDRQVFFWGDKKIIERISTFLVLCFLLSGLLSFMVHFDIVHVGPFDEQFIHPFFAVEVAFTILLIFELLSLIFVLPKSVARSMGKQFELLSMIFLRNAFKEFSHLDEFHQWDLTKATVFKMLTYSFGALLIFFLMGLTQRLNKKIRLSETYVKQIQFVRIKKLLAFFLLITFYIIGVWDIVVFMKTGKYLHSFDKFYTVLIFTDIVIVLIALRHTINYYRVFRYSAFVLATILIRISLSLQPYYDVLLGIITAIYVLALSMAFYHIQSNLTERELNT